MCVRERVCVCVCQLAGRAIRPAGVRGCCACSLGPRPFFGEEKRPSAICSRMHEKLRKITVKSLVYVEVKYTAEVIGTRLLIHVYTSVHG